MRQHIKEKQIIEVSKQNMPIISPEDFLILSGQYGFSSRPTQKVATSS
jgi:hypothetical protein